MKLLNRTIKNYLLYSTLLVLCCTPVFYFAIEYLFERDMDEVLISHKKDFNQSMAYMKSKESIEFFHLMNKEFILMPVKALPAGDSLFTQNLYDSNAASVVPHRIFRTGVVVQGRPYELQIRESMLNSIELIATIMGIQALMIMLLLAGLILINRRLTKTVWNPFYILLDSLRKYHIDQDKPLVLPRSSTVEFRDLSAAITQLIDKNHEAYLIQKEFTENASHELQTPLAISRSKLELLAQTKELTREQAELVGNLLDAMDRIARLNKNLLLLSKIENLQFFETEDIHLEPAVKKAIDAYERQAQEKQLTVSYTVAAEAVLLVNPILLDVLISNVISNAIRHATENSVVIVEGTKTYIDVSNAGLPLSNPEKIFQRFHRESRTTLGSGLGLSIVKKVCDVSGYHVAYSYTSDRHHFKITF